MKYLKLLFVLVLTGCASMEKGPIFSPEAKSADKALIYVYRDDYEAPLEISTPLKVLINEENIGQIPNQSYIFSYVEPGVIDISTIPYQDFSYQESMRVYVEIEVEAGQTLYFKKTKSVTPYTVRSKLQQIPESKALKELSTYHKAVEVKD